MIYYVFLQDNFLKEIKKKVNTTWIKETLFLQVPEMNNIIITIMVPIY